MVFLCWELSVYAALYHNIYSSKKPWANRPNYWANCVKLSWCSHAIESAVPRVRQLNTQSHWSVEGHRSSSLRSANLDVRVPLQEWCACLPQHQNFKNDMSTPTLAFTSGFVSGGARDWTEDLKCHKQELYTPNLLPGFWRNLIHSKRKQFSTKSTFLIFTYA